MADAHCDRYHGPMMDRRDRRWGKITFGLALLAYGWHIIVHVLAFLITAAVDHRPQHRLGMRVSVSEREKSGAGGITERGPLAIVAFPTAGAIGPPGLRLHWKYTSTKRIGIACLSLFLAAHCKPIATTRTNGGSAHDHDLNLRAAYMHVLADAFHFPSSRSRHLTGGIFRGGRSGWWDCRQWRGFLMVLHAVARNQRDSSRCTPPLSHLPDEIRRAVESDGDSVVTDLHVWQVGIGKFAAMVSIVAHQPKSCDCIEPCSADITNWST